MQPILEIKNISKKFRISHEQQRYLSLRDSITSFFSGNGKTTNEEFWALKDVSFDVYPSDSIGIIGKNGAGKSTLLKILSKITPPTEGKIISRGRIASLLEVGTGFHGELSGRENIFLNGSILGMKRKEIQMKFDEIVDFSGVEKFLDTPLKHYSSGMQLRLAFAVAAFLEPEILIIDEVLAVGDAEFQKKCFGKMQDIKKKDGRTILLVSHSMTSIKALSDKALVLEKGLTEGLTNVSLAIEQYLYANTKIHIGSHFVPVLEEDSAKKDAYIIEAKLLNEANQLTDSFFTYEPINIEIKWVNNTGTYPVMPNFAILNREQVVVIQASDAPIDFDGSKKKAKGIYLSKMKIPGNLLNSNSFIVYLALNCGSPKICFDVCSEALKFTVIDTMDEKNIARGNISTIVENAVLWPALECSFAKISD